MPVKIENMLEDTELYTPTYQSHEFEWEYNVLDLPTSEFMASVSDSDNMLFGLSGEPFSLRPPSPLLISESLKHQLLHNHDCMWSGQCGDHMEKAKCPGNHVLPANVKIEQDSTSILEKQKSLIKHASSHNIPAGSSLLRYNQQYKKSPMLPNVNRSPVKRNCDILRPDTPLSLDNDPPEFKHTFDLAACTMGSNKWNLSNSDDDAKIITLLKEHLEDSSSDGKSENIKTFIGGYRSNSLSDLLRDIKTLSDYEEEEEADDSAIDTDQDDIIASISRSEESSQISTPVISSPISSQLSITSTGSHPAGSTTGMVEAHSDHCYTRTIDLSGLGVQTPSDSEEEIDVVSVGDKTLPTNPSARDRRTIQTTISDRIVKTTPRGLKTIPPRRINGVVSDPPLHASMSSRVRMPHLSVSSTVSCGTAQTIKSTGSYKSQNTRKSKNDVSRKRTGSRLDGPPNKKHKSKKGRVSGLKSSKNLDICEQDSIEKRNLHNDMERQRRIGLKNLFEALKAQIPSLRDNERAPKVNILREAAMLCTQLYNENERLNNLKRHHSNIQSRLRAIKGHLTSSVSIPDCGY